jgi:hypothetical protein
LLAIAAVPGWRCSETARAAPAVSWYETGRIWRERLWVGERALDRSRPAEKAVTDRLHVLPHYAQAGLVPQEVGHLLHHAGAAVLHRQHGRFHSAHHQRLERQAEGRKPDCFGVGKQGIDRLVGVGARLSLVGDFHPKIR